MKLVFSAPVKNCATNLKKNIEFINELNNQKKFDSIQLFILESDSTDNTKSILKDLDGTNYIKIFYENNLHLKIPNRVNRIAYCRNYLINKILDSKVNFDFYVPLDLDIDLFALCNVDEFYELALELYQRNDKSVYFPNSKPYYYDVAALRSKSWVDKDPWYQYYKFSKYIPIGKVFIRLYFIFSKQKKISIFSKPINVKSAFGGIGIYKINEISLKNLSYLSDNHGYSADHVSFNQNFSNKFIIPSWVVKAPIEHIEYKTLSRTNKIKFLIKELLYDLKNLLKPSVN